MKRISVIICTHNRRRYLDGSFGSLLQQTLPRDEFEIILVDNASTDGTREWGENAARIASEENVSFVYWFESELGLSAARNAGWRLAQGDIVAFLDDDAVARADWLERILEVFGREDERLGVVGGKVEPLWEAPPPDWLVPELWSYLSVLDLSPNEMVLKADHWFVGANMIFRKGVLAKAGGFSSELGRKGKSLLSNEEDHLRRRLEAGGYYSLYCPQVVVKHTVPAERMTREWFRRRLYWQGRSAALTRRLMAPPPPGFASWSRRTGRAMGETLEFLKQALQERVGRSRRMRSPRAAFQERERWGNLVGDWRILLKWD